MHLAADGKVLVQCASHEIGTGVRTIAAQQAAERLGVEVGGVSVEMGDSELPPAPVSGGSNSTASVCSTVLKACDAIRQRLFRAAITSNDGPLAGKPLDALELRDGAVIAPDGASQKLADVFKAARPRPHRGICRVHPRPARPMTPCRSSTRARAR